MAGIKSLRRADTRSGETEYSGLPKSCKLWSPPQGNPWVANTLNIISYSTVGWNYGGFTFVLGGAVYPMCGIYIPENGLYTVEAEVGNDRASTPSMTLLRNGAFDPVAGCWKASWSMPAAARGASMTLSGTVQCKTGDYLQVQTLVDTAMNTDYLWFGATKLGGQY